MNLIETIEQRIGLAEAAGFQVRFEYFGGAGGGICSYGGKRWMFLDLTLTAQEQLDRINQMLIDEQLLPGQSQRAA